MEFLIGFITNPLFISAGASWFFAQVSKVIICIIKGEFSLERIGGGGGMPSSHSATVTGLVTATAFTYGSHGFEFPMALFFAFIVIYDAMGVRMQTGLHAKALNQIYDNALKEGKVTPVLDKPLKEKMGHTLPEIIVGIILGLLIACLVCQVIFPALGL